MSIRQVHPCKTRTELPVEKPKISAKAPAEAVCNPAWARLALGIRRKLEVGAPSEREADRVADQVMRMPEPRLRRACTACRSASSSSSTVRTIASRFRPRPPSRLGWSLGPARMPASPCSTARRAIGYAESWPNYAPFWSPNLYDFIAASLAGWSAAGLGTRRHKLLELFAPLFRLQHPGTAAFGAADRPVIVTFQTEVAGRGFPTPSISSHAEVQDRTRVADRATGGDGSWASAPGLPGLGSGGRLTDSFFSLSPAG